MKNAKPSTGETKNATQPAGMPLVAMAHALNLLQAAGYHVTATDTPTGVAIAIEGIVLRQTEGGRVAFQSRTATPQTT